MKKVARDYSSKPNLWMTSILAVIFIGIALQIYLVLFAIGFFGGVNLPIWFKIAFLIQAGAIIAFFTKNKNFIWMSYVSLLLAFFYLFLFGLLLTFFGALLIGVFLVLVMRYLLSSKELRKRFNRSDNSKVLWVILVVLLLLLYITPTLFESMEYNQSSKIYDEALAENNPLKCIELGPTHVGSWQFIFSCMVRVYNDFSFCESLDNQIIPTFDSNPEHYRSECYFEAATYLKDSSICDKITVNYSIFDSKDYCKDLILRSDEELEAKYWSS